MRRCSRNTRGCNGSRRASPTASTATRVGTHCTATATAKAGEGVHLTLTEVAGWQMRVGGWLAWRRHCAAAGQLESEAEQSQGSRQPLLPTPAALALIISHLCNSSIWSRIRQAACSGPCHAPPPRSPGPQPTLSPIRLSGRPHSSLGSTWRCLRPCPQGGITW